MKPNKQAFTLIELLVVVLIIGILAAVALPQYQRAVVKGRVAAMLPLLKSIADAQAVYYLTNATWAADINNLDIAVPNECSPVNFKYKGTMLSCGNHFIIDMNAESPHVSLNYCPDNNTNWTSCNSTRDFNVSFGLPTHTARCHAYNNSKLGQSICAGLAGSWI